MRHKSHLNDLPFSTQLIYRLQLLLLRYNHINQAVHCTLTSPVVLAYNSARAAPRPLALWCKCK